jgi:hypothetical protein
MSSTTVFNRLALGHSIFPELSIHRGHRFQQLKQKQKQKQKQRQPFLPLKCFYPLRYEIEEKWMLSENLLKFSTLSTGSHLLVPLFPSNSVASLLFELIEHIALK